METARNRFIWETHRAHPELTYRELGEAYGVSPQRAWSIVHGEDRRAIMDNRMEEKRNNHRINGKPISATEVSRLTGIPLYTIASWARRGLVKIISHPGHTARGKVMLLDPQSLQERIDRYRPRPRQQKAPAS